MRGLYGSIDDDDESQLLTLFDAFTTDLSPLFLTCTLPDSMNP